MHIIIIKQTNTKANVDPNYCLFFLILLIISSLNVSLAGAGNTPFSPKAYLIRYWNYHITGKTSSPASPPPFFLSKASPLSALDSAVLADLAANKRESLSSRLLEYCSAANILCGDKAADAAGETDFSSYVDKNFTRYGESKLGGAPNSFENYSSADGGLVDSFSRYSRRSTDHDDRFTSYIENANQAAQTFDAYGTGATRGAGDFKIYANDSNVPFLRFTTYSDRSGGRKQRFKDYGEKVNFVDQSFAGYGEKSSGAAAEFSNYASRANLVRNGFESYGQSRHRGRDSFNSYIKDINLGQEDFTSYGGDGESSVEEFKNYRIKANQGQDSFKSYAVRSKNETVNFKSYGKSFSFGESNFTTYGGDSTGESIGFQIYGDIENFKEYANGNRSVSFATYNVSSFPAKTAVSGSMVNSLVEEGKFFRESMLKEGVVMAMPDIRDKMPERSFLPRAVSSKLPFSTLEVSVLKTIFHGGERMIVETLTECERAPSKGETKQCVSSAEDMIDFATSVLGPNVVVRTTDNVNGSTNDIMIGLVRRINGGRVTMSVSCHQSLFPYLVYYCHSVPKVRVYEADILDPNSKAKINRGVAVCHVDTSAWSPTHAAFLALGSGPGRIEICHWIFENDMTWCIAD